MPGGKTARRRRAAKPSLKLSDDLDAKQIMPEAGLKTRESLPRGKRGGAGGVYRKIVLSFVALVVILVAVVLYLGLTKVALVIIPVQEKITDSLSLAVADKANSPSVSRGQVAGVVRQVPVEQSGTFAASGKEILGQEVSGKVTIINNYLKNQPLVATTRLLSQDNKLFRLRNTVYVPAGGQVVAEVYADEAKSEMAIGPSEFTIPGLWAGLQDKIYAQSQEPMKYNEKIKYTIKQSDIDGAVSELKKNLLAKAKKEVGRAYQEYDQLIFEVDNTLVSQEVQGKVGEEKENFTMKMKTKMTVVAFDDDDVYKLAEAKLAMALADDREIVEFDRSAMTYSLANSDPNQGTAVINVNFTAKAALKDSAKVIKKDNLTGLNMEQLKTYLNSLPEVAGYEIKFFPSFIRKMPNLVDRIEVVIKK
jgi:hypothetical protein